MDTDPPMDFKLEDYNEEIVNRGLALQNRQLELTQFSTFITVQLREV